MHENRSFDHYFGSLGGVDGFNTKSAAFAQPWPGSGHAKTLLPFHLDSVKTVAECTNDLSHSWQAEHASWNHGAMNKFVSTHTSAAYEGPSEGTLTMGYYTAADMPFYHTLAKNFTICDRYFCSVLGPTHPNRMLQMTGTLDPAGARRRTDPGHQRQHPHEDQPRAGVHVFVADDARGAPGRRGELEGLQPVRPDISARQQRCRCSRARTR